MSTRQRQALGLLTNQTNKQPLQQQQQHHITKQVITHNKDVVSNINAACGGGTHQFQSTYHSTTTSTFCKTVNDENDYQQAAAISNKQQQKSSSFDIFQDNNNDENDFQIFCDSTNKIAPHQAKKQPLQQQILNILDVSAKLDSPMMLDDTIKQLSKSDIDFECSGEESIEIDDEELDEVKLKKQAAIDRENLIMNCDEYAVDILKHLKELEMVNRAKPNYIKQQQDITSSMRSILVDWLVEVCEEYKLHSETLYLAVNYTDRFLSKMSVLRGKLQLLGTASIYIASKYEEIFPPDINDFVYITDDTYTKQQVLRMEHLILKVLNFHMNAPTANCFLLYFLRNLNADKKSEHLARYIAELTLVEAEPFLEYLPSQIASSALYISLLTLGKVDRYNKKLEELTGYKYEELKQCISDVYKCMCAAPEHPQQAIQDKYKQERYDYVALIEPPSSLEFIC